MEWRQLEIEGLVLARPTRLSDARGWFAETFREDRFRENAGEYLFVQENESKSVAPGTIRGLHFQDPPFDQGKLVRCLSGAIHDVAVDLRPGSPTFGRSVGVELSADLGDQLWIPPGFAHGFCTLRSDSVVAYKVTAYYSAAHDRGVRWNDPAIGIAWPACADPRTLSAKDRTHPLLSDLPLARPGV